METLGSLTVMGVISMVMNGLPVEATKLQSSQQGCAVVAQRARMWRTPSRPVVETKLSRWCSVGAVIEGYWISEQWERTTHQGFSRGWRVKIPVSAIRSMSKLPQEQPGATKASGWGLDLLDSDVSSRVRFRSSPLGLDSHHQRTLWLANPGRWGTGLDHALTPPGPAAHPFRLSRLLDGTLILSGRGPSGESYSVLIDRRTP